MSFSALRVGILGLGQIGGSIATRLSILAEPPTTLGFDLRPELTAAARERHIVDAIAESEALLIELSDLVVIAIPVREALAFLTRHHEVLQSKMAVTDTGSLKQEVTQLAAELQLRNFVGGHPLAGTEKRGVASWNGALFEDANYFLTNGSGASKATADIVTTFVTSLGAKAIVVDADRHDHIFSITSNLPHVIAYSLKRMFDAIPDGDPDKILLRAPSFLGATRVADSDPEGVFQMLWHNRGYLSVGLTLFLERLIETKSALDDNDEKRFRQLLGLSSDR